MTAIAWYKICSNCATCENLFTALGKVVVPSECLTSDVWIQQTLLWSSKRDGKSPCCLSVLYPYIPHNVWLFSAPVFWVIVHQKDLWHRQSWCACPKQFGSQPEKKKKDKSSALQLILSHDVKLYGEPRWSDCGTITGWSQRMKKWVVQSQNEKQRVSNESD